MAYAHVKKMTIVLTDKQKEIPVSLNSLASMEIINTSGETKDLGSIFRANKEQL